MAAFTPRERDAFLQHWRERVLANRRALTKTIVVDDSVAGYVGSWSSADGERLVAYWLDRELWGRGVGSTALRVFLDIETTRALLAWVAVGNVGSIRVLERCGFRREGEAVSGGDDVEEYLYSIENT